MKNKLIWTIFSLVFLGSIFFWYYTVNNYKVVEIKGKIFKVELAKNLKERSLGLGQRRDIKDNSGMLFIFPESGEYTFWMKDMQFDLDIVWINNGKIVYIKKNIPYNHSELINPRVSANYVLEFKAGTSDKYNFSVEDEVKIY